MDLSFHYASMVFELVGPGECQDHLEEGVQRHSQP